MMIWNRKADVCYDLDTNIHSKCRVMSSVLLTVERKNKSELRFKKIIKNLILNSYSHVKYDKCTFWFQNS